MILNYLISVRPALSLLLDRTKLYRRLDLDGGGRRDNPSTYRPRQLQFGESVMTRKHRIIGAGLVSLLVAIMSGCAAPVDRTAERFGKTFYLDGAGNWGFGSASVPKGLKEAGYKGDVEIYVWTTSFNPLIDQLNIIGARLKGEALSKRITEYRKRFPNNKINMIALSAGTGVAVWGVEGLEGDTRIDNLILLGSSLSHDYDVRKALSHMNGKIYVYHSPHDAVLGGVRVIGTIDGKRGVDSVGLVGLTPPRGLENRVVNIAWNKGYMAAGWTGAHTDTTSERFVRQFIARHVAGSPRAPIRKTVSGSQAVYHTLVNRLPRQHEARRARRYGG